MIIKEFIKRALFYISVPCCVLCRDRLDYDDNGLCKACLVKYKAHKERNCSRCSKKLQECLCPTKFLRDHSVKRQIKLFRYMKNEDAEAGKHLIFSLKRDNREDVLEFLSSELASAVSNNIDLTDPEKFIFTNVPRRSVAILELGFDHTEELAKLTAQKLGIQYKSMLISRSKRAQKEMMGEERLTNVNFDYKPRLDINLKGRVALIVDDLVTTGASMASAAMLIRGLGAKECIAVSVAVAHDEYTNLK